MEVHLLDLNWKEVYILLKPKYEEIFFTEKKEEYLENLKKEIDALSKKHKIKVKMFLKH